jgi:sigma-54 dependent transcriptional regulator, acetoin dehydrogenase operon transcriptional activator AcoR
MMRTTQCEREQLARERDAEVLPRRLVASWRRSADHGVPLDAVRPEFAGAVDDQTLFFDSGRRVLDDLYETLDDEPVSLMLTDTDGLVLNRMCRDRRLLSALDGVSLAPGFDYSERTTGTTGLGLALADRAPTLVRGEQHYCTRLWGYTCAAAPVTDPRSGDLVGSVNLTTWSDRSYGLLLALARSAARSTESLMLARGRGREAPAPARGRVALVRGNSGGHETTCSEELGPDWRAAADAVRAGLAEGRGVAVVGEPDAGRSTLLGESLVRADPARRVIHARVPAPERVEDWWALWSPELGKPGTTVVVGGVDELPAWVVDELGRRAAAPGSGAGLCVTAEDAAGVPAVLRPVLGAVVELPALRHRRDDVLPLARWFARSARGPGVRFTPGAEHALASYHWPGNVSQLRSVVREAVARTDVVGDRDLRPEVFTGTAHGLTRLEMMERDEIVRALAAPGATPARAAAAVGLSRSTIYRRIARYGIRLPAGPGDGPPA